MDLAYMDAIAAQVDQEVCELNMDDTSQCNTTGDWDEAKAQQKKMKVGFYKFCHFNTGHHRFFLVCRPTLRRKKVNKKRSHKKLEVRCLLQKCDYSRQFHWINEGNGNEALYDLKGSR